MTLPFAALRAVLLDLDGVVWRGDEALPGTPAFFDFLAACGIPYIFLTNNSTRTPESFLSKLHMMGIKADVAQVINSGVVTVNHVAKHYPAGTPVYVVGSAELIGLLASRGYPLDETAARVVVVGLDTQVTYQKLTIAGQRILAGAAFIGTNPDSTFPLPDGLAPGAGSLIATIQTMTGVAPPLMGKPAPAMYEMALARLAISPHQTLMIGDRLDTDIAGAVHLGIHTALVETGIHNRQDAAQFPHPPSAVYPSLEGLYEAWRVAIT
jgi:4-nitrophenyl phosphatase